MCAASISTSIPAPFCDNFYIVVFFLYGREWREGHKMGYFALEPLFFQEYSLEVKKFPLTGGGNLHHGAS